MYLTAYKMLIRRTPISAEQVKKKNPKELILNVMKLI